MTNRDAAVLAFKVLGVYLVALGIANFAGVPVLWELAPHGEGLKGIAAATLPAIVMLCVAVSVWYSAEALATRIFPLGDGSPTGRLRFEPIFALGLAVLGVLLLCQGIPPLFGALSLFLQSRQSGVLGWNPERAAEIWNARVKASVAESSVRILLGVACIAGPARLSALFVRIRRDFQGSLLEEDTSGPDLPGSSQGVERPSEADRASRP